MAKIDAFFNLMFEQKASDLHLSSANNPMLRINGELHRVDHPPLDSDALKTMLYEIAPDYKIKVFEETVLESTKSKFGNRIEIVERVHAAQMDRGKLAIFVQCLGKIAPLNRESVYRRLATLPRLLA